MSWGNSDWFGDQKMSDSFKEGLREVSKNEEINSAAKGFVSSYVGAKLVVLRLSASRMF